MYFKSLVQLAISNRKHSFSNIDGYVPYLFSYDFHLRKEYYLFTNVV